MNSVSAYDSSPFLYLIFNARSLKGALHIGIGELEGSIIKCYEHRQDQKA